MSRKKQSDFLIVLEEYFTNYLPFSKGLQDNTIKSYRQSFLLLIEFMYDEKEIPADRITFRDLDYDTLLGFFDRLEKRRHCKAVTRNQRLSAISAFSEYAQNRDFEAASVFRSSINKIPLKKSVSKPRAVFTREEVGILLGLPNERTETGLRNKVLLSLMYASGARSQEICDLTVRDLQFHDGTATLILTGKGNKTRRIGLPSGCVEMLRKYLKHRQIEALSSRHVFSSQTHEQMTVSCIEGIFNKYVTIAKNEHPRLYPASSYPPHSMRHSTASHLLEAGVDIVTIKNILGHVSLQTTEIYTELSQETVDKRLREWNQAWFPKTAIHNNTIVMDENGNNIPAFLTRR